MEGQLAEVAGRDAEPLAELGDGPGGRAQAGGEVALGGFGEPEPALVEPDLGAGRQGVPLVQGVLADALVDQSKVSGGREAQRELSLWGARGLKRLARGNGAPEQPGVWPVHGLLRTALERAVQLS